MYWLSKLTIWLCLCTGFVSSRLFAQGLAQYPQVDTLASGSNAGYRGPKLLQMNQRDGTNCDASDQAGPALQVPQVSRGLAVGDLFNEGNMDIVVENLEGAPMILRNRGIAGQHWVSFELAGTKSNRLAIGS